MLERAKKGVRLELELYHHKSADVTTASDRTGETVTSRGGGTTCQGGIIQDGQGLQRYVAYSLTLWILVYSFNSTLTAHVISQCVTSHFFQVSLLLAS